jgi:phosphate transport system substrate-binding protein
VNSFKVFVSFLIVLFVCSCLRSGNTSLASNTIQIKGSDTIVNLIQDWSENFIKKDPSFNIGITGGGSGTGFAALINGTCDIAMSSRKIEQKEIELAKIKGIEPVEFKVGLDGLVLIVNKNNPISKLTLDQIRDIFIGKITNWKELGGDNLKIVILSRESNSGTNVFFKESVLRQNNKNSKEEFAVQSLMMPSSQAIYDEVRQNPNAIGYVGMGFVNTFVKSLAIARSENEGYVKANVQTVADSSYPISRPLYLYTNGNPQGIVNTFIDYALSDEGQSIVLKEEFVPVNKVLS